MMGNRSSESLKDRPKELEIDEPGRHSKCDLDLLNRIPELEKSRWRRFFGTEPRRSPLILLRILDDSEPGVDMYEGVRPLISVEVTDSGPWPETVGSLRFTQPERPTHPTEIIICPALKIKLTEEGKKVKEVERSTSTVCTWNIITAASVEEKEVKMDAFFGCKWVNGDMIAKWPMRGSRYKLRRHL